MSKDSRRIDERDIMFARYALEPGSERFADYYAANPGKRAADERFRSLPGLLADDASAHEPLLFAAANASFDTVRSLRALVDGEVAPRRVAVDAEQVTGFLSRWINRLGAHSVGVTELRDEHLYSHVGRGEGYGEPVRLAHRYAIVLTTEMAHDMVRHAPLAPTTVESARSYLESGAIAVQVAALIRRLGYPARAHIDGDYRVVCPLVARDAGLGEIGRMGLLITPTVGPRVRIAVITTDLPLVVSPRRHDPSVEDLCSICDRCRTMCPAKAIPHDKRDVAGEHRWQIDSEACFTFWCRTGTDCARCLAVCPQAHPDRPFHRAVRWGVRRSRKFRRLALRAEKVVYGNWPAPRPLAPWMRLEAQRQTAGRQAKPGRVETLLIRWKAGRLRRKHRQHA
jgi:hypothetical protein